MLPNNSLKSGLDPSDKADMKLFRKNTSDERRVDREYDEAVNHRMKSVLARPTNHDDAELVEQRLRNMVYGTNKR
ncbi:MAG: hypothetical protein GWP18_01970 [Proteobacteria bacterium]|nr:hypothetical protein [Pseudomonadota bacterium]